MTELYERFAPVVFRRAVSILGHEADAWDVTQDVFRKLLESPQAFRGEARPMTYVYRITTNLALNALRAKKVREPGGAVPDALEPADSGVAPSDARNLLHRLANELDGRALQIAALHFLDGLTQEEISEVVGLSRKTIGKELTAVRERAQALAGGQSHG
ncbi:MAG: sigma-70 family RNA polymerase sigma factor [Myxococcales bacterium]